MANFLYDLTTFQALQKLIIPKLFGGRRSTDEVRVWVSGCATGEEAYLVSILLHEYAATINDPPKFHVFVTDTDEQALSFARRGFYREIDAAYVLEERYKQFFTKEWNGYRVKREIRDKVIFAVHNFVKDPPLSRLDFVLFQNLLDHTSQEAQRRSLKSLQFALYPAGYLLLKDDDSGRLAEKITESFSIIDKEHLIFRARNSSHRVLQTLKPTVEIIHKQDFGGLEKTRSETVFVRDEPHEDLRERFAFPSLIVNCDYNIVHLFRQAKRYLRFREGEATLNLLDTARSELRSNLQIALHQAVTKGKTVEAGRALVPIDDKVFWVNVIVQPIKDRTPESYLVTFIEAEVFQEENIAEQTLDEINSRRFEQELYQTRQQLQLFAELHEVTYNQTIELNQALHTANEKLLLTSAQMEAGKEELLLVNQELIAINSELNSKMNEIVQANSDLQNLLTSTDIATIFLDTSLRLKRFTPQSAALFNFVAADVGRSLLHISHNLDYEQLTEDLKQVLDTSQIIEREVRSQNNDWFIVRLLPYRTVEDKIDGVTLTLINISQRKQAEEKLIHEASHDALTGLINRSLFTDYLKRALARARRCQNYFVVMFIDLDRFKIINDSLGHLVGDQLIIEVARKLERCARPTDAVARLGGDEFTILLEDINDVADAQSVADRIHKELAKPLMLGGHEVRTTASIGIVLGSSIYEQPEQILRDADTALYRAKSLGRARHELFDLSMHESALQLLKLDTDLRRAVERDELRLTFQPIVSLLTKRFIGFEALVRWEHPERGLVLPAEFIPLAEETGIILPIGEWVLRQACRQMRHWLNLNARQDFSISVNLSTIQFKQPNLFDLVKQILQETKLNARNLKLEITESAVMDQSETAIQTMQQLQELGVELMIDDFGTGYSSLSYLSRLPVGTLKIDRTFVSKMTKSSESLEVVRTIIMLANNLRMNVVAEGVETHAQLKDLQTLGCLYGQGYLFCKPLYGNKVAETFLAA